MIDLSHISRVTRDGRTILNDISFHISKGEVVSVIGPSGSGKSSLFRCITGLDSATEGTVSIGGKIGALQQHFNLFPHMTLLENVTLAPRCVFGLGAEMEGIFEKSINSIGRGQWEAGKLLGMSRRHIFRKIIWPQALPSAVKSFKGRAISLIENTSIVGFIAIEDLTKVTDIIRSQTYNSLYPLITVAIIYFLIALLIGVVVDYAGEKLIKNYTK